jgi:sugar-specific transcriptional regulator TrmB
MDQNLTEKQKKVLYDLGLGKIQTQLYLCSLKQGVLSVLELSRLTKINRQQIYQAAEELVDLGLYDITRKRGRKYIPASASKLAVLNKKKMQGLEDNISALNALIPILENISVKNNDRVIVKYYEGLEKIKEAYQAELRASHNSEGVSFVGSLDHTYKYFPHSFWDQFNKKYVQAKNNSKMLVHYSDLALAAVKDDRKYRRETRYLNRFPLKVNIDIFNATVLLISFEEELAIWIESPVLASSCRILFYALWAQAKEFKKEPML